MVPSLILPHVSLPQPPQPEEMLSFIVLSPAQAAGLGSRKASVTHRRFWSEDGMTIEEAVGGCQLGA